MTQNTLARLARCVKEAQDELGQIRISGSISEVRPAYARVAGLSRFLKLGECGSFSAGGLTQLAEVVRIDELGATVKTFGGRTASSGRQALPSPGSCATDVEPVSYTHLTLPTIYSV